MNCYHCGDLCSISDIVINNKHFCCFGCKTVYEIIEGNNLDGYYKLGNKPGLKIDAESRFDFLKQAEFQKKILEFENDTFLRVTLFIPQIHCGSCIWLLENVHKLNKGIVNSSVDFNKKKVTFTVQKDKLSLHDLAKLLASIGYTPDFSINKSKDKNKSRLLHKIGVAGFCFGNIMLLSFPDYLGMGIEYANYKSFFTGISCLLSMPVLLFSSQDYWKSAWNSLKIRKVNMDVPISLGMLTLFARSLYEFVNQIGTGYWDSFTGLVFFLLVGKWFQQKTYDQLSFDRDYKSYFPISVNKLRNNGLVEIVNIDDILPKDVLRLRNNELIPADSILLSKQAVIDYSFVTGESETVVKTKGDLLYAGGKQIGSNIEVQVVKNVAKSYLTKLWNQKTFHKQTEKDYIQQLSDVVSKYFTGIILLITALTGVYWQFVDPSVFWQATTSVLIIACPCALALSIPFTNGSFMRFLGNVGIYLKNANVLFKLSTITWVAFDKTGTITYSQNANITYKGGAFNADETRIIKSVVENSIHPLSVSISRLLHEVPSVDICQFKEHVGKGIEASANGLFVQVGSPSFIGVKSKERGESVVCVSINGTYVGTFYLEQNFRNSVANMLGKMKKHFNISLISGDNDRQSKEIQALGFSQALYNQQPIQKLQYIKQLQDKGEKIAMIGDGLNDAGALKQSNVGIALSDQISQFSPACDVIFDSTKFPYMTDFLRLGKVAKNIIFLSFILSFMYNVVGISFAVQGRLSPIFAAILMPISSISIVLFTTFSAKLFTKVFN